MTDTLYTSPIEGEFHPHNDPDVLEADFKKVAERQLFTDANPLRVDPETDEPLTQVAMRPENGIYMTMHPQSLYLSQSATTELEGLMAEWFSHYPIEPTYARTQHGQPMMLTRFDGTIAPDGTIGLCEFDDVPTGFNALRSFNPVAATYVDAMVDALGADLHSVFLSEEDYVYPHDDDKWLPSLNGDTPSDAAVIPRARRVADGFDQFMDEWGERSIVAARERDNKGPLLAMGLGTLAVNLETALEVASRVKGEQPIFMKALKSSRTEAAAAMASNKWKIKGAASPNQVRAKFERAGIDPNEDFPMVLQPFHRPPTMADLGLKFREGDAEQMAVFNNDARNDTLANLVVPGKESSYHVLSRIYGAYIPGVGHKIIGGFWMARPNAAIIHGASDSIAGALRIEGLTPYEPNEETATENS